MTQKALFKNETHTLRRLAQGVTLLGLTAVAACGGGMATREARNEREAVHARVEEATLNRTLLDAHVPTARPVEARLVLPAAQGAMSLSPSEREEVTRFATDFLQLGRGNVIISVPANAGNSQSAALIAQETQRALFAGGVDFAKISGGAYQAQGQANAPVIITFGRYEAVAPTCQPWTAFDPRKTASNMPLDRFACAQNANLAAMVADPGDLLGDRRDQPKDAARGQNGVDAHRKGAVPAVSGAVAGGGGGQ